MLTSLAEKLFLTPLSLLELLSISAPLPLNEHRPKKLGKHLEQVNIFNIVTLGNIEIARLLKKDVEKDICKVVILKKVVISKEIQNSTQVLIYSQFFEYIIVISISSTSSISVFNSSIFDSNISKNSSSTKAASIKGVDIKGAGTRSTFTGVPELEMFESDIFVIELLLSYMHVPRCLFC